LEVKFGYAWDAVASLSKRLATGAMGIVAKPFLYFPEENTKVSVKEVPFFAQNLFTQITNYFLQREIFYWEVAFTYFSVKLKSLNHL